jgi:hypothetical protein
MVAEVWEVVVSGGWEAEVSMAAWAAEGSEAQVD